MVNGLGTYFQYDPEPIIADATSSESAFDDSEIFAAAEAFLKVPPTVIDFELAPARFFLSPPIVFILSILHDTMPASFSLLLMSLQFINSLIVASNQKYGFLTLPIAILKQYFRSLCKTFFIIKHEFHFALDIISFLAIIKVLA